MPFENWMWAIWLGIMVIMVIIECMGPALVSIWFAAGAFVSLVLALLSLIDGVMIPWWVQVIVFVVVSAITLIALRPLSKKYFKRNVISSNVDSLVGKRGLLEEEIKPFEPGVCRINDVLWTAISTNGKETIASKSIVEVVAIQGNKLLVKKVEEK
ncbi:MAG: NfeD family protein [Bacilli bacterium]|nr:NfeD family protein [Bacilli bacterium]